MSVLSSSVDRAGRKIIVGEGLLTVLRNGIFFLYHGELAEEQTLFNQTWQGNEQFEPDMFTCQCGNTPLVAVAISSLVALLA